MEKGRHFLLLLLSLLTIFFVGCDNLENGETLISEKIVYEHSDGNHYHIYIMGINGENPTNLTQDTVDFDDRYPVSSPDGSRIAFVSKRDADEEIYVMNADGSEQTRLTNSIGPDFQPVWSPDGSMIAFVSYRTGNADIFVVAADGGTPLNISETPDNSVLPSWSPDSQKIVFQDGGDICVANSDGTAELIYLTNTGYVEDNSPVWSPDGTKIAFQSEVGANDNEILVMDVQDITEPTVVDLTDNDRDEANPVWSPDSSKVAFVSLVDYGDRDILVANADGLSLPVNITDDPSYDEKPVWSSDGSRIIFETYRDGNWEIYMMDANGGNPVNLTQDINNQYYPCWAKIIE